MLLVIQQDYIKITQISISNEGMGHGPKKKALHFGVDPDKWVDNDSGNALTRAHMLPCGKMGIICHL